MCRAMYASILLARDEVDAAAAAAATALESARLSGYNQQLGPALGARAATLAALGQADAARQAAVDAIGGPIPLLQPNGSAVAPLFVDLAFVFLDLDLEQELLDLAARLPDFPWTRAARALGRGRPDEAADLLQRLRYPVGAARARLRAAAPREAAEASSVLRSVGATRWLRDVEASAAPA